MSLDTPGLPFEMIHVGEVHIKGCDQKIRRVALGSIIT